VFLPANAKRCRVFFEPLTGGLLYFLDGVQFNESPVLPEDFSEETNFFDIISVQDVYPSTDPKYYSMNTPDNVNPGYGPIEEAVENTSVLNHADALIYAKSIFDVRALPQSSETAKILQFDAPFVLYAPDGFMQFSGIEGFDFPKLWPARVTYTWDQTGLVTDIELEKEVPRLEQVLERERALSIISVGKGTDSATTYQPPENDTWTITAGDSRLSTDDSGNTVFTETLDFEPITASLEIAVRGLEVSPNWAQVVDDGTGAIRHFTLTLYPGMTLEEGDTINLWYRVRGGIEYASKTTYITATGAGEQTIVVAPAPLGNSARVKVRGLRLFPSEFTNTLNSLTGSPDTFIIDASVGVEVGDEIAITYDPDYKTTIPVYTIETTVPVSSPMPIGYTPYQWPDTNWGFELFIGDQMQYDPNITNVAGTYFVDVPTDRAGDRLLMRIWPNLT
jgi:hypothetical protein